MTVAEQEALLERLDTIELEARDIITKLSYVERESDITYIDLISIVELIIKQGEIIKNCVEDLL